MDASRNDGSASFAGTVDAASFTVNGSPLTGFDFPSGTVMLFYQANAPTGFTKITTQNNKALRVVSGTGGGTGGSVDFTTAFSDKSGSLSGATVGGTTLTTGQMASHDHPHKRLPARITTLRNSVHLRRMLTKTGGGVGTSTIFTPIAQGGGGSHTHSLSGGSLDLDT